MTATVTTEHQPASPVTEQQHQARRSDCTQILSGCCRCQIIVHLAAQQRQRRVRRLERTRWQAQAVST